MQREGVPHPRHALGKQSSGRTRAKANHPAIARRACLLAGAILSKSSTWASTSVSIQTSLPNCHMRHWATRSAMDAHPKHFEVSCMAVCHGSGQKSAAFLSEATMCSWSNSMLSEFAPKDCHASTAGAPGHTTAKRRVQTPTQGKR